MTALTLYGSDTAATTVSTAGKLTSTNGTPTIDQANLSAGTGTGWGEFEAQGGGGSYAHAGSQGSPSGKGWLWDVTTLESQQLFSGNWSASAPVNIFTGSMVADVVLRAYKRSSGGTYTLIGSITLSSQTITSTFSTLSFPATSFSSMNFSTGDKLYFDLWFNITSNSSSNANIHIKEVASSGAQQGDSTVFNVVTAGYGPQVTTSTRTIPATFALKSLGLQRTIPATIALKSVGLQRTIPATFALKSLGLQRVIPASLNLTYRFTRTIPATFALKSLGLQRTIPATFALKSLGLQRVIPASFALKSLGLKRTIPASVALTSRIARTIPATVALKSLGLARTIPASISLVWGPRPILVIKQMYIKVYTATGTYIDCWRDAQLPGDQYFDAPKFAVNTATSQVNITLPRPFDNFDEAGDSRGRGSVGAGNIVQVWVVDNDNIPFGRLVYQGYIDGYQPQIDQNGQESVQVTVTPFDTVIGDVTFLGTQTFGIALADWTYEDPVLMFDWPFENTNQVTGQPYPYPLTLDPTNPTSSGAAYAAQWSKQNLHDWWEQVRTIAPANWFWRPNPNKTVTFNQAPTTPTHTFIVGKHIVAPQYQLNYQTTKNYIWVQGTACQSTAQGADIAQLGQRTLTITEPRIIDQNTCNRYASATLAEVDVPGYRSLLTIIDYRGETYLINNINHQTTLWDSGVWDVDSWDYPTSVQLGQGKGLGYDIERIQVGDTCRIVDPTYNFTQTLWDSATWDVDSWDFPTSGILGQVVVIVGLTYKFFSVDLELAILQPSQDRFLVDLANQFAASQLG